MGEESKPFHVLGYRNGGESPVGEGHQDTMMVCGQTREKGRLPPPDKFTLFD